MCGEQRGGRNPRQLPACGADRAEDFGAGEGQKQVEGGGIRTRVASGREEVINSKRKRRDQLCNAFQYFGLDTGHDQSRMFSLDGIK